MTKKSIVILGVFLSLGLFLVALGSIFAFPVTGPAREPQRFPVKRSSAIHKIGGGIFIGVNSMQAGIHIRSEKGVYISDALVMLNHWTLSWQGGSNLYYSDIPGSYRTGTQLQLRIWLNMPFHRRSVPNSVPDYVADGTIAGWLTPVFPVWGSSINLAVTPNPTFRWAVAGAMGTVICWDLEAPPDPHKFYYNCGSQLAVTIPAGTLVPNTNYKLTLQNTYLFTFAFNLKKPVAPDSKIVITQTETINFNTL